MRGIKRDQRLIEKQQAWPADQRLAQEHTLAFAPRQFADRALGEAKRAHFIERPIDLAPRRLVESDQAEAAPDRGARDNVPAGKPQARDRSAILRHVADLGIAARRRLTKHGDRARSDPSEPERGAHEGRLAGAIGAEHADELAFFNVKAGGREDVSAAKLYGDIAETEYAQLRPA